MLFETTFDFTFTGAPHDALFSGLSVAVPGTFTWAVRLTRPVGLVLYDPPTVGSSGDFHWLSSNDAATWTQINFLNAVDNFRARVTAVPEPGTLVLTLAGLAFFGLSLRGRRQQQ